MAKRQASLLCFCQSTHKRLRESEEKADDDQDQESDDSDCQDVQVEDAQKNLNMNLNQGLRHYFQSGGGGADFFCISHMG